MPTHSCTTNMRACVRACVYSLFEKPHSHDSYAIAVEVAGWRDGWLAGWLTDWLADSLRSVPTLSKAAQDPLIGPRTPSRYQILCASRSLPPPLPAPPPPPPPHRHLFPPWAGFTSTTDIYHVVYYFSFALFPNNRSPMNFDPCYLLANYSVLAFVSLYAFGNYVEKSIFSACISADINT